MFNLANRCCMLLLALPLGAAAASVTVTTRSSGLLDPNPAVLSAFGLDYSQYSGGPLPFDLTISSTFGPPGPGYFESKAQVDDYNNDVALSFRLGTSNYHYTGPGATEVLANSTDHSYLHEIWFVPPEDASDTVFVSNIINDLGGSPLTRRTVDFGAGLHGNVKFNRLPNNPDAPGFWLMFGDAQPMSLQVVSTVPEPGRFGMLAIGVLTLGLWRRRTAGSVR